jgi:8-oxo-dGTP pyrophosphatase MutT (NUDIX family)
MESDKKKRPKRKIVNDKSIGIIVFLFKNNEIEFLLIKHEAGHWAFPKGHPDKGETPMQTAKRELFEETGVVNITLLSDKILLKDKYFFSGKNRELIKKVVDYYIAETEDEKVKIDEDEITDYRWCTYEEALKYLTHKETEILLTKAFNLINQYKNEKTA